MEALDTALNSHTVLGAFTDTAFSLSTGKVTIAAGFGFELDWTDASLSGAGTALRDLLGYTANKTGASSYESDAPAQYIIATGSGRSNQDGPHLEKSGGTAVAESGVISRVGGPSTRRVISWEHVHERYTYQASPWESGRQDEAAAVVPWTWSDWYEHHSGGASGAGEPFRYYSASTDAIASPEGTYVMHESMANDFKPDFAEKNSTTYNTIKLKLRKFVAMT